MRTSAARSPASPPSSATGRSVSSSADARNGFVSAPGVSRKTPSSSSHGAVATSATSAKGGAVTNSRYLSASNISAASNSSSGFAPPSPSSGRLAAMHQAPPNLPPRRRPSPSSGGVASSSASPASPVSRKTPAVGSSASTPVAGASHSAAQPSRQRPRGATVVAASSPPASTSAAVAAPMAADDAMRSAAHHDIDLASIVPPNWGVIWQREHRRLNESEISWRRRKLSLHEAPANGGPASNAASTSSAFPFIFNFLAGLGGSGGDAVEISHTLLYQKRFVAFSSAPSRANPGRPSIHVTFSLDETDTIATGAREKMKRAFQSVLSVNTLITEGIKSTFTGGGGSSAGGGADDKASVTSAGASPQIDHSNPNSVTVCLDDYLVQSIPRSIAMPSIETLANSVTPAPGGAEAGSPAPPSGVLYNTTTPLDDRAELFRRNILFVADDSKHWAGAGADPSGSNVSPRSLSPIGAGGSDAGSFAGVSGGDGDTPGLRSKVVYTSSDEETNASPTPANASPGKKSGPPSRFSRNKRPPPLAPSTGTTAPDSAADHSAAPPVDEGDSASVVATGGRPYRGSDPFWYHGEYFLRLVPKTPQPRPSTANSNTSSASTSKPPSSTANGGAEAQTEAEAEAEAALNPATRAITFFYKSFAMVRRRGNTFNSKNPATTAGAPGASAAKSGEEAAAGGSDSGAGSAAKAEAPAASATGDKKDDDDYFYDPSSVIDLHAKNGKERDRWLKLLLALKTTAQTDAETYPFGRAHVAAATGGLAPNGQRDLYFHDYAFQKGRGGGGGAAGAIGDNNDDGSDFGSDYSYDENGNKVKNRRRRRRGRADSPDAARSGSGGSSSGSSSDDGEKRTAPQLITAATLLNGSAGAVSGSGGTGALDASSRKDPRRRLLSGSSRAAPTASFATSALSFSQSHAPVATGPPPRNPLKDILLSQEQSEALLADLGRALHPPHRHHQHQHQHRHHHHHHHQQQEEPQKHAPHAAIVDSTVPPTMSEADAAFEKAENTAHFLRRARTAALLNTIGSTALGIEPSGTSSAVALPPQAAVFSGVAFTSVVSSVTLLRYATLARGGTNDSNTVYAAIADCRVALTVRNGRLTATVTSPGATTVIDTPALRRRRNFEAFFGNQESNDKGPRLLPPSSSSSSASSARATIGFFGEEGLRVPGAPAGGRDGSSLLFDPTDADLLPPPAQAASLTDGGLSPAQVRVAEAAADDDLDVLFSTESDAHGDGPARATQQHSTVIIDVRISAIAGIVTWERSVPLLPERARTIDGGASALVFAPGISPSGVVCDSTFALDDITAHSTRGFTVRVTPCDLSGVGGALAPSPGLSNASPPYLSPLSPTTPAASAFANFLPSQPPSQAPTAATSMTTVPPRRRSSLPLPPPADPATQQQQQQQQLQLTARHRYLLRQISLQAEAATAAALASAAPGSSSAAARTGSLLARTGSTLTSRGQRRRKSASISIFTGGPSALPCAHPPASSGPEAWAPAILDRTLELGAASPSDADLGALLSCLGSVTGADVIVSGSATHSPAPSPYSSVSACNVSFDESVLGCAIVVPMPLLPLLRSVASRQDRSNSGRGLLSPGLSAAASACAANFDFHVLSTTMMRRAADAIAALVSPTQTALPSVDVYAPGDSLLAPVSLVPPTTTAPEVTPTAAPPTAIVTTLSVVAAVSPLTSNAAASFVNSLRQAHIQRSRATAAEAASIASALAALQQGPAASTQQQLLRNTDHLAAVVANFAAAQQHRSRFGFHQGTSADLFALTSSRSQQQAQAQTLLDQCEAAKALALAMGRTKVSPGPQASLGLVGAAAVDRVLETALQGTSFAELLAVSSPSASSALIAPRARQPAPPSPPAALQLPSEITLYYVTIRGSDGESSSSGTTLCFTSDVARSEFLAAIRAS